MMSAPRIFVGTLACGEAEFEDCCEAIAQQKNVLVHHHIISDLPEFDAHKKLWKDWSSQKQKFDLFVKVDADTVLSRNTALNEIHNLFSDPSVTGAQILLHDFFTNQLIPGLNAFSLSVSFRTSRNRLFADHSDYNHNVVLKGDAVKYLAPIGFHSPRPHPKQAFHFGLHRTLKKQYDILKRCSEVWLEQRDECRSWALTGALATNWWMKWGFDYESHLFQKMFLKFYNDSKRLEKVEKYASSFFRG